MTDNSKVQIDLLNRIKRARVNFKKSPKERLKSRDYLSTRFQMLEELWSQFNTTHTKIVLDNDPTELEESYYNTEDVYNTAEELYIDYKLELKSAMSEIGFSTSANTDLVVSVSKSETATASNIRLPKITIQVFSGKYSEWTTFRDLFTSLIHKNNSLDDVQKLHYLKGLLVGEAEQLVRHVNVTKENYQICWELLEKRYDNKKYQANHILKKLMSQRNLVSESANGLKELLDTTRECLHALENIGVNVSSWDIIVIHIICLKLDPDTRKQWELKASESSEDLPTLKQFFGFLETRFRALEFVEPKTLKSPSGNFGNKGFHVQNKVFNSNALASPKVNHVSTMSCSYCSEDHMISNCKQFAKLDTDNRRDFVQSRSLCFNCLGANHSVFACRQSTRCRICYKKHHSLLHLKGYTQATDSQVLNQSVEHAEADNTALTSSSPQDEPTYTEVKSHHSTSRNQVLLPTALVKAQSNNGSEMTLRCFIDQGSQSSFITEPAVQLLGLKRNEQRTTITVLRDDNDRSAPLASMSKVEVKIQSLLNSNHKYTFNANVLNKLTTDLPEERINVEQWSAFNNLELADPSFYEPNKIDIILGGDIYGQLLEEGLIKSSSGVQLAQKTTLGWILSGPTHAPETKEDKRCKEKSRVNKTLQTGGKNIKEKNGKKQKKINTQMTEKISGIEWDNKVPPQLPGEGSTYSKQSDQLTKYKLIHSGASYKKDFEKSSSDSKPYFDTTELGNTSEVGCQTSEPYQRCEAILKENEADYSNRCTCQRVDALLYKGTPPLKQKNIKYKKKKKAKKSKRKIIESIQFNKLKKHEKTVKPAM